MSGATQRLEDVALELAHHYVGGDGEAALRALLSGFERADRSVTVEDTHYDNLRLQVKSRILGQDPPDAWTGWPGGEIEGYAEVGVVADVTELWESSGMTDGYRDVAADAARVDGQYYAVPIAVHRINDLYVHTEAASAAGIDPTRAGDPAGFVEMVEEAAATTDGPGIALPMADPFPTLQLWEVILLGLAGHRTFEEITGGDAARHRDEIRRALDLVDRLATAAGDGSLYETLTDANEQFQAGTVPVYPQGDWAAGVFDEADDFAFGTDWDRVPFPGTENMYAVVLDAVIPSASSDNDGLETFLEYAGSADGQERFSRKKGSLPARADVSMEGFGEFARSQKTQFDRATEHPQSITHGLSVSPAQLVDLKTAIAEFLDRRDVDATADEMVGVFDR
jgi:glucose/mannose transport system substrate-binding protein